MSFRELTIAAKPEFPWLTPGDCGAIESLMQRLHWLRAGEKVTSCERAGEGNMNLTLRVQTDQRSLILKQARPWVEKYDHIPAPWDRNLVEQRFYDRVATIPDVASRMPRIMASDAGARVLLMEDLGVSRDFTDLYRGGEISDAQTHDLAHYLRALHDHTDTDSPEPGLLNREMRALNHTHIFEVPLRKKNGVPLEKLELWLDRAADALRADKEFAQAVADLGTRYLEDGPCLLHGDYFPGSWLRFGDGVRIIDPEFCFYGDPEFDLGIAVAHFRLANQDLDLVREFLRAYSGRDLASAYDVYLLAQYAGVEVVRRLIGVAQLPLPPTQGFRAEMLRRARAAIFEGTVEALWI